MFSKTLLIVDDTPLFIRLAKDLFRREQVDILTAHSGPEAVEIAKHNKTDLILMDLYMTEGDGDDAAVRIYLAHYPDGPEKPEGIASTSHPYYEWERDRDYALFLAYQDLL